ncbi:MAG: aldolase [Dethiobacteria bacterium]|jgi:L-fuculose-phosphate aldolase
MWREISKFGRKVVEYGLTGSHFGNISVRAGDSIIITRSGSMLDEINENMVVECHLYQENCFDTIASSEIIVHRRVYQETSALAIVHVHSPFAVILSLLAEEDFLTPEDTESKYFLHRIPLIRGGVGSAELAQNLAEALSSYKAAIARGHGTFATGKILEEAYVHACSVEHACKVQYYCRLYHNNRGPEARDQELT